MADFEFNSLVLEFEAQLPLPLEDFDTDSLPAFAALVRELYPRGPAWPNVQGSTTDAVLTSIAAALVSVEHQVHRFRTDTNPLTTIDLVEEWERALDLPDDCQAPSTSLEDRRRAIVAALTGLAGASTSEVLALLARLGYSVTLQRFEPFKAGSGDAGELCYGVAWQYVLGVHYWGAGDRAALECLLPHRLPAHVVVVFYYGEHEPQKMALDFTVPPILSIT